MEKSIGFVRLKCEEVKSIIRDQQLKRWWVAEFTGVHKTTLRRWLSGRIDRVRQEHATALAQVLTVDPSRIAEPANAARLV
jgi:DNA-binding transcriptional regulator YiaG